MPLIGLISDTHALVRPEALAALRGCDHIIHAGDVGSAVVLDALRALAPLTAVRGNNDHGDWAEALPASDAVEIAGTWLYVLHDLAELDLDPAAAGFAVVVAGHSHRPLIERRRGVLFVNPGSAGPRRFTLPIAVAHLHLGADRVEARLIDLSPRGA